MNSTASESQLDILEAGILVANMIENYLQVNRERVNHDIKNSASASEKKGI